MKLLSLIPIFILAFFTACSIPDEINPPSRKVYQMEYEWPGPTLEKLEKEIKIIKDLEEGKLKAKAENKSILLVFAAIGSVHCRELEEDLMEDEQLLSLMKNNFVNVWLWVDEKRGDWRKWNRLQFREFQGNYQPHIFVLDQNGQVLGGDLEYKASKERLLSLLMEFSAG